MNTCRRLFAALVCLGSFGCHGGGDTDLLERELRWQEDHIYELQDQLEKYEAMLDSCHRQAKTLKQQLGHDDYLPNLPDELMVPGDPSDPADVMSPSEPRGPVIEMGTPLDGEPGPEPTAEADPPDEAQRVLDDEPVGLGRVDEIVLNPLLTGGLDMDGQPGDDGIMVVLEPRSETGQIVRAVGDVSIMVVDPRKPSSKGQIARWDFTAQEASGKWQASAFGRGLHFELPWPDHPPGTGQLKVWARLLTRDGRKFLADKEIHIDREGPPPRWLPAADLTPHDARPDAITASRRKGGDWSRRPDDAAQRPGAVPLPNSAARPLKPAAAPARDAIRSGRPRWSPFR